VQREQTEEALPRSQPGRLRPDGDLSLPLCQMKPIGHQFRHAGPYDFAVDLPIVIFSNLGVLYCRQSVRKTAVRNVGRGEGLRHAGKGQAELLQV
jgi:hypothetical protein